MSICLMSLSYAKTPKDWLTDAKTRIVTEVLPNGLTVACYPMAGQHSVRVSVIYDVAFKR